ncbi:Mobile element protein [Richelia intracellularis]|nr:Mobile element protein [Richelia intracellularis]
MAGKITLNRLEHCPEDVSSIKNSRYYRIDYDAKAIKTLLVELFLESYHQPPRQIINLDVTDDLVHAHQEETFFNPYYKGYCYDPLYIFCGKHLLAAKLRASNLDPAASGLEELQRVIKIIRCLWKKVKIIIRGDSPYSREEIMAWFEDETDIALSDLSIFKFECILYIFSILGFYFVVLVICKEFENVAINLKFHRSICTKQTLKL